MKCMTTKRKNNKEGKIMQLSKEDAPKPKEKDLSLF